MAQVEAGLSPTFSGLLSCTHDGALRGALAKKPLASVAWGELEALGSLREVRRLISMHKTVVSGEACPGDGTRSLRGYTPFRA